MVASAGMHEGGEVISSDWSDEEVMLEGITWIGLQGGPVRIDADLLRGEVTVRFAVRVVEVGSSVDEVEDHSLSIVVAVSSTCRTAKHSSRDLGRGTHLLASARHDHPLIHA